MDDVISLKEENERLKRELEVWKGRCRELEAANRSMAKKLPTPKGASRGGEE